MSVTDSRIQWHGGIEHLQETFLRRVIEKPTPTLSQAAIESTLDGVIVNIGEHINRAAEISDEQDVIDALGTASVVVDNCLEALSRVQDDLTRGAVFAERLSAMRNKMSAVIR